MENKRKKINSWLSSKNSIRFFNEGAITELIKTIN